MAIYYLKSTGSNDVDNLYNTEEGAATSLADIKSLGGFAETDTIILCDDVEQSDFDSAGYNKWCSMRAKEGLSSKPIYYSNYTGGPFCSAGGFNTVDFTISGIELRYNNSVAPMFFVVGGWDIHVVLDNCKIVYEPSGGSSLGAPKAVLNSLVVSEATGALSIPLFYWDNSGDYDITLMNNTIIDKSNHSGGAPIMGYYGSGSIIKNNIFHLTNPAGYPSTYLTVGMSVPDSSLTNNLVYIYGKSSVSFIADFDDDFSKSNGVDNSFADPLFAEEINYTLSSSSPAIGAGIGGSNIGWDQLATVAKKIVSVIKSLFIANPNRSYACNNLKDTKLGGGLDTNSINDYDVNFYKREPRSKPFNGYRAPNLR